MMTSNDSIPAANSETPIGYVVQTPQSLPFTLSCWPAVAERLGGSPADWQVREVGDGNLNLVFLVYGPSGSLAVKQALPYLRVVGDGWPLPLKRATFEYMALVEEARVVPDLVPELLHHEESLALTVMELLSPHIIMRKGLIRGIVYPKFAEDIAHFLAQTLFSTSDLAVPAAEKKALTAAFCANSELCKITEDLIFTDPYRVAPLNRWTTPQLDEIAARFRADEEAKVAINRLKARFLGCAEALIHGDLHTGSIMITETDTQVIDPEFAFVGPMGFDIGAVLGNLLLAAFSQAGHAETPGARVDYAEWLLRQVETVWTLFAAEFTTLWMGSRDGDLFPPSLFDSDSGREALAGACRDRLAELFDDTVGFAAAKMIRRILGLAHVEDLESIGDPDRRAACETAALSLARDMLVNRDRYRTVESIATAAWERMPTFPLRGPPP